MSSLTGPLLRAAASPRQSSSDGVRWASTSAETPLARSRGRGRIWAPHSVGAWVMLGVPALLVVLVIWQIAANLLQNVAATVPQAVVVSTISLEPDPLGSRVDMVLADRVGQETSTVGDLTVQLHEPDGSIWQSSRSVNASDFRPLPAGGLLAGRIGYALVIPGSDWQRAPRRGGAATISVSVQPTNGTPFSMISEARFP